MSGEPWHGTVNGYTNRKCRCDACQDAWRAYIAEKRAARVARLAADPDCVEHGLASTYANWGCRCRPCTDAWSDQSMHRERRRKAGKARETGRPVVNGVRDLRIRRLAAQGVPLGRIADRYGVTYERVRQIVGPRRS